MPAELCRSMVWPVGAVMVMLPPTVFNVPIALLGAVIRRSVDSEPPLTVIADAPEACKVEPALKVRLGVLTRIAPPPLTVCSADAASVMDEELLAAAMKAVVPGVRLVCVKLPVPARVKPLVL